MVAVCLGPGGNGSVVVNPPLATRTNPPLNDARHVRAELAWSLPDKRMAAGGPCFTVLAAYAAALLAIATVLLCRTLTEAG